MSEKDTGGPAFPCKASEAARLQAEAMGFHFSDHEGMTLRDYFAAKAMQAILPTGVTNDVMKMADASYEVADAMLKARQS
jgi:hypothetical protein